MIRGNSSLRGIYIYWGLLTSGIKRWLRPFCPSEAQAVRSMMYEGLNALIKINLVAYAQSLTRTYLLDVWIVFRVISTLSRGNIIAQKKEGFKKNL